MLISLVGIVILLGGLIFFHESGHYSVAKFFNVKVEVFSLGFGKKFFSKKWGETEYCLSLIPFGGYVKLMGDDPTKGVAPEEAHRAFSTQKLYKRFLIVAAGPMFNLILAYILFAIVFWNGQPTVSSKIGSVAVGSPAWNVGVRPKDRIVELNGKTVTTWNEIEETLKPMLGKTVDLKVEREGSKVPFQVEVSRVTGRTPYGEEEEVGGIKGLSPSALEPVVGVSDVKSIAYVAGFRTGDLITKIENKPITLFEDINDTLKGIRSENGSISIVFKRKAETDKDYKEQTLSLALPKNNSQLSSFGQVETIGFFPMEVFVRQVNKTSPAESAGLKAGDRIVKVAGEAVYNFEAIVERVQQGGAKNKSVAFEIERDGKVQALDMTPQETTLEDPLTRQPYKKYLVGFAPATFFHEAELIALPIREPVALVSKAFSETNLLAKRMLISLGKLVTGKVSVKNLGGPVLIASVAGKSLSAGFIPFIQVMALISINLFLLNLFPIPVLDGGHLLFFTIEAVKGKPVSLRTMEIANQVGMVFILTLVALTLFNDITRLIFH